MPRLSCQIGARKTRKKRGAVQRGQGGGGGAPAHAQQAIGSCVGKDGVPVILPLAREGDDTLQGADHGHGGSEAPGYARRVGADGTDGGRQASTSTFGRRAAEPLDEVEGRAATGADHKGVADEVDEAVAMVRDVIVHRHYISTSTCGDGESATYVVASEDVNR